MDKDVIYVARKLFAIRIKHRRFLLKNKLRILLCVRINWTPPISAHCTIKLPYELTCDIEEMFWVS